jgi:hypothetical protein
MKEIAFSVVRFPFPVKVKPQVSSGSGLQPRRVRFQTDAESTQLVGAEAPTHLNRCNTRAQSIFMRHWVRRERVLLWIVLCQFNPKLIQ